jgi:hypothetical protein
MVVVIYFVCNRSVSTERRCLARSKSILLSLIFTRLGACLALWTMAGSSELASQRTPRQTHTSRLSTGVVFDVIDLNEF